MKAGNTDENRKYKAVRSIAKPTFQRLVMITPDDFVSEIPLGQRAS
jgi:hypothetical protein